MRKIIDFVGNTAVLQRANGWLVIHWALHFPVVVFLYVAYPSVWEKASILYLALVSIYANFVGHLSAWQSARVERKQEIDADVQETLDEIRELHAMVQKFIERQDA